MIKCFGLKRIGPSLILVACVHCGSTDTPVVSEDGGGSGSRDAGAQEERACDNRPILDGVPMCVGCPDEKPGMNCYPPQKDGGIYGRCRKDGEEIEGKIIGAYCCNRGNGTGRLGTTIPSLVPNEAGECVEVAPPSIMRCSQCGDKRCQSWENRCSCPIDCS